MAYEITWVWSMWPWQPLLGLRSGWPIIQPSFCISIADQGLVSISDIVRSRKVTKPRDLYLELSDRSEIGQAPRQQCCRGACQISKRCDDLNYKSRGFMISRDLTIRHLIRYWSGFQASIDFFYGCPRPISKWAAVENTEESSSVVATMVTCPIKDRRPFLYYLCIYITEKEVSWFWRTFRY